MNFQGKNYSNLKLGSVEMFNCIFFILEWMAINMDDFDYKDIGDQLNSIA